VLDTHGILSFPGHFSTLDFGDTMTQRYALVCCGKQKLTQPAAAKELYCSTLFQKTRSYVERHYTGWFVLSALYNVLPPDQVVVPYDFKLNRQDASKWADVVVEQLAARVPLGSPLDYFGGATYGLVVSKLEAKGYLVQQPLAGLQVGQRLHWLKVRDPL
jgi:hypothetical protein